MTTKSNQSNQGEQNRRLSAFTDDDLGDDPDGSRRDHAGDLEDELGDDDLGDQGDEEISNQGDDEDDGPGCSECDSDTVHREDASQLWPDLPSVPLCRSCIEEHI